MKPIACVAPDGSLEVWIWSDYLQGWMVIQQIQRLSNKRTYYLGHEIHGYNGGTIKDPAFWGREAIGVL